MRLHASTWGKCGPHRAERVLKYSQTVQVNIHGRSVSGTVYRNALMHAQTEGTQDVGKPIIIRVISMRALHCWAGQIKKLIAAWGNLLGVPQQEHRPRQASDCGGEGKGGLFPSFGLMLQKTQ